MVDHSANEGVHLRQDKNFRPILGCDTYREEKRKKVNSSSNSSSSSRRRRNNISNGNNG